LSLITAVYGSAIYDTSQYGIIIVDRSIDFDIDIFNAISNPYISEILWDNFFNILKRVEDTQSTARTARWLFGAFPDRIAKKKTDYPIMILKPIDITELPLTPRLTRVIISVKIEVYATKAYDLDLLTQRIYNKFDYWNSRLREHNIQPLSTPFTITGNLVHSGIRLHYRRLEYRFEFIKNRSEYDGS